MSLVVDDEYVWSAPGGVSPVPVFGRMEGLDGNEVRVGTLSTTVVKVPLAPSSLGSI